MLPSHLLLLNLAAMGEAQARDRLTDADRARFVANLPRGSRVHLSDARRRGDRRSGSLALLDRFASMGTTSVVVAVPRPPERILPITAGDSEGWSISATTPAGVATWTMTTRVLQPARTVGIALKRGPIDHLRLR